MRFCSSIKSSAHQAWRESCTTDSSDAMQNISAQQGFRRSDFTACTFCHDKPPANQQLHFISTKALCSHQDFTQVTRLDVKSKFIFSLNVYNKVVSSKTVVIRAVPRPEMTCPACPHYRPEINYIQDRRKLPFAEVISKSSSCFNRCTSLQLIFTFCTPFKYVKYPNTLSGREGYYMNAVF